MTSIGESLQYLIGGGYNQAKGNLHMQKRYGPQSTQIVGRIHFIPLFAGGQNRNDATINWWDEIVQVIYGFSFSYYYFKQD
jgi:hypothetical protein